MLNLHGNSTTLLCVKIMDSDKWGDSCSITGATKTHLDLDADDLALLLDYLSYETRFTQFWLPAKWLPPHNIRWMLPGRFGDVQALNESIGQPAFQGKGCILLQVIGDRFILSSHQCHNKFPMLCLYAEESPLLQLGCPENHFAIRYGDDQSSCHTVESFEIPGISHENTTLFKMASIESTYVAQKLMALDTTSGPLNCIFDTFEARNVLGTRLALGEVIPRRLWETFAADTVQYVNWMKDANFLGDLESSFLVADRKAEWTFHTIANCMLVTDTLWIETPVLKLSIVPLTGELQLLVLNADKIWREPTNRGVHCFCADDLETSTEKSVQLSLKTSNNVVRLYSVQPIGSAIYWCEFYQLSPIKRTESNVVFIDSIDTFVGTVTRQCECLDGFINLTDWMLVALRDSAHQNTIHIDNIELVQWQRFQVTTVQFIQIHFRATVQSITGVDTIENPDHLRYLNRQILRIWHKQQLLEDVLRTGAFYFPVVLSTEYCLPMFEASINSFILLGARTGQTRTPTRLCLQKTGQPVLLQCEQSAEGGAAWQYLTPSECFTQQIGSVTQELFDIVSQFDDVAQTTEILERVADLTQDHEITSFELFSISNIMARAATLNRQMTLDRNSTNSVCNIYDRIMSLSVKTTQESTQLNATNVLLASFEAMINNMNANEVQLHKNFQLHIIDPAAQQITGLVLHNNGSTGYLYENQTVAELLAHPSLRAAIYLPETLIAQLPVLSKIAFMVYKTDALFQAPSGDEPKFQVSNHIISLSIPNIDTSELPEPIPIFFKFYDGQLNHTCGFWVHDNQRTWIDDGLKLVTNTSSVMLFNATHLTNFALLIRENIETDAETDYILFLITVIGSCLSLLGILGIFVTAIRFSAWREKSSNQLLLQLSIAIALMLIIFFFVGWQSTVDTDWLCIVLGASLHYLVLVTFMWMLVMAYLQFMRYVIVFIRIRSDRFVLKLSVISWCIPTLPVITVLGVNPYLYVPQVDPDSGTPSNSICYPTGLALILSVMVPVALIVMCNLLIFALVIYNLLQIQKANRAIVLAQMRVSAFLFFLLGLTWIFGLLSQVDGFSVVFLYLFCATATLQGFVLFGYFVVLEPSTRKLWASDVKRGCRLGKRGSMSVEAVGGSSRQTD